MVFGGVNGQFMPILLRAQLTLPMAKFRRQVNKSQRIEAGNIGDYNILHRK
jgi:hypothetical protein